MTRMRMTAVMVIGLSLTGQVIAEGAEAVVGQRAPGFSFTDTQGRSGALSDFRGRVVVLEWLNPDCPFVRKHYESRNMQGLQAEAAGKNVVWLSIISSAPGKQGHRSPPDANAFLKERGASPTALILDESGAIGRLYGAKTTPHMFVIDPDSVLRYNGAIDDHPSTDPHDIPTSINYVRQALEETMAGQAVSIPGAQPYGCSVKY